MHRSTKTTWLAVGIVWALTLRLIVLIDGPRIEEFGWLNLAISWNSETTLATVALLILPGLAILFPADQRSVKFQNNWSSESNSLLHLPSVNKADEGTADNARQLAHEDGLVFSKELVVPSLLVAFCALMPSWMIGQTDIDVRSATGANIQVPFADLPPAYHDEYSYLLQAETFAAKRLAWPKAPVAPDLFHQFHVLNNDVTVSRYFPLTGLWIVPSLAIGYPFWGHWLAGSIASVMFFWSARMIMPRPAALLSGHMIAFSPAVAIFSNMLLAHHPVLLMLSIFLFAFLKLLQPNASQQNRSARRSFLWAFVAGCGLSAAMLGRPMTAAGFSAPFGLWLLWRLIYKRTHLIVIPAFALPLVAGFGVLAILNAAATGSPSRTAYQEYTDQFTPRHKYGFDNAVNCEVAAGPMALKKYDQWATNLDWPAAIQNVKNRTKFSLFWTWNLVLLGMGLVASVVELIRLCFLKQTETYGSQVLFRRTALAMLLAAIVSLHLVHIPYWYSGIMEWHYVFETAPLIVLLTGFGLSSLVIQLRRIIGSRVVTLWICGMVLATIIPAWVSSPEFLGPSKVSQWINQTSYSRRRIAEFRLAVAEVSQQQKTLILVDESGTDPQLSFIINPPSYQGQSLVCRLPSRREELVQIAAEFPDRKLYYFDANQAQAVILPFNESIHRPK